MARKQEAKNAKTLGRQDYARPFVQRPLGLLLVGVCTYLASIAMLSGVLRPDADAAPPPMIPLGANLKDTAITSDTQSSLKMGYAVDPGAGGVHEFDLSSSLPTKFIDLGPPNQNTISKVDMNDTTGELAMGNANGDVMRIDPSSSTVTTVATISGDAKVLMADESSPSTEAWATDGATSQLMEIKTSGATYGQGMMSFPNGPFEMSGKPSQPDSNVFALGKGSAEIVRFDSATLTFYDDSYGTAVVKPTGLAVGDGDYCYVSVENGADSELLQVDTRAATFGFVTPILHTFTGTAAVDVSIAGPWVTVLLEDSGTSSTVAHVFDVGNPGSTLEVGTVMLHGGQLPYGGLTTWLEDGESYDDLNFLYSGATQDVGYVPGTEVMEDWSYGPSTVVTTATNKPIITNAASGAFAQEALNCTDCPCPPFDAEAQGMIPGPTPDAHGSTETGVSNAAASPGSVQYSTGEEVLTHNLVTFPGVGLDLTLSLTYRSRRDYKHRYGNNWFFNHDVRVHPETNGDVTYQSPYGRLDTYKTIGSGSFQSPVHYDTTLVVLPGIGHQVTDRFGTVSTFDLLGQRISLADRYQNTIAYTWQNGLLTGIRDTLLRDYVLNYDANARLSSIVDYGGRIWTFNYDYMGNLRTISAHGSNGVAGTFFSYTSNDPQVKFQGNLLHVTNPNGERAQTLEYDEHDMVVREKLGDGEYFFSYDTNLQQTTVIDRVGTKTRWTFGAFAVATEKRIYNQGIRPNAPVGSWEDTKWEVDPNTGMVVTESYYAGGRTEFIYDNKLNLTNVRRKLIDTATDSSTDLVTTYEYAVQKFNQLKGITDPMGNYTAMTIDLSGNTISTTRPTVTQPVSQTATEGATFDTRGRITSSTDSEGRLTTFTYYNTGVQFGYLYQVIRDPSGLALTTTFDYDQYGNVIAVTDPLGKKTEMTVNLGNYVTEIKAPAPLNYRKKLSYDKNGNLTLVETENIDKDGVLDATTPWIEESYTYNELGWRLSSTRSLTATEAATTSFEYDFEGRVVRVADPTGIWTKFQYDERGFLFKIKRAVQDAPNTTTVTTLHDARGNLISTTDAEGNTTASIYDNYDRITRRTNALGNYIAWTYDKNGNVLTSAAYDASAVLQSQTTNHFDERDRIWKRVRSRFGPGLTPSYPTMTIQHDMTNRVTEIRDPLNNKTTYSYDAVGRQVLVQDAIGNETEWILDARGQATKIKRKDIPTAGGSETFETEFVYDVLGRMTSRREIDRLNASNILTTNFSYDSRGNLTFRVDAEGNPVRWTYDLASRQTSYERALATGTGIEDFTNSILETATYDAAGRLKTISDDNLNTTIYAYDSHGRMHQTTFADAKTVSLTFDKNNLVKTRTDQNGTVVTNSRDVLGRLTSRSIARASGVLGDSSEVYTYDALNRVTKAWDSDYQVVFTRDSMGNLLSEKQGYSVAGQEKWKTVTSSYTDAGSRSVLSYPSGFIVSYQRDAIYRMTIMTDALASANIATFTFQGANRLAKTTNQNSTTTDHGYDGFARLSQLDHKNGSSQSFHMFDYLYDKVHNRRMEKNSFNSTWINALPSGIQPFLNGRNGKGDVYAYDMAYRMVDTRYDVTSPAAEVATPGSQTYVTKQIYTLDGLGNRSQTQQTPWGGSSSTTTYTFNAMNEYTAIGSTSRTHDSNGSLTNDGTQTYHYDYQNRLIEVRAVGPSTLIARYKYDALGRRVEKYVASGTATTRYVLDGSDIAEEYDGADTWAARYFHEDRIDHPRAMDRADISDVDGDSDTSEVLRFHYHQNALGSVSEVSAPGGGVVEWVTYDVYGKATVRNSAGTTQGSSFVGNPFLFTGREFDAESGMYHYRARAYDPEAGRFLQRDPLGYVDGLNLLAYVASNPVTLNDPLGQAIQLHSGVGGGAPFSHFSAVGWGTKPVSEVIGSIGSSLQGGFETLGNLMADVGEEMASSVSLVLRPVTELGNGINSALGIDDELAAAEEYVGKKVEAGMNWAGSKVGLSGRALGGLTGAFGGGTALARRLRSRGARSAPSPVDFVDDPTPPTTVVTTGTSAAKKAKCPVVVKERVSKGADGATSRHIIEKDAGGNTNSKTHVVEKDGEIIHQHQEHVGKEGSTRRFPDSWTGTKSVNARDHVKTGPRMRPDPSRPDGKEGPHGR